jgi:hypothetical protein
VAGCCEHNNKDSGSINDGEFFDQLIVLHEFHSYTV